MNECVRETGGCGEDFATVPAFDDHRVGVHDYTFAEGLRMDPPRDNGRRCLDVDEMVERGWDVDRFGRWRRPTVETKSLERVVL